MAENNALTLRQRKTITALLAARNVPEAAQAANVGERSVYRWLADPAFRAALLAAEGAAVDTATRRLVGLSDGAIDTLAEVMTAHDTAPAVRLRAAQAVLDTLLKMRDLRNVEERLTRLEAILRESEPTT